MQLITISIIFFLISFNLMGQTGNYTITKDSANGSLVFNGVLTFDDLGNEKSFDWMTKGVVDYQPNETIVAKLKESLKETTIVLFLGTWCDDSHYLIPKLEKVLKSANYDLRSIKIFGVDRKKVTKNGDEKPYNITLVPTIIFYRNGKELGRIIETYKKSIEADILDISLIQ